MNISVYLAYHIQELGKIFCIYVCFINVMGGHFMFFQDCLIQWSKLAFLSEYCFYSGFHMLQVKYYVIANSCNLNCTRTILCTHTLIHTPCNWIYNCIGSKNPKEFRHLCLRKFTFLANPLKIRKALYIVLPSLNPFHVPFHFMKNVVGGEVVFKVD